MEEGRDVWSEADFSPEYGDSEILPEVQEWNRRRAELPIALFALAEIVSEFSSNPEHYDVGMDDRKSPYSAASLYAAHVYRLANPKLDSHRSLHNWLTIYDEVARAFGFGDDRPSEATLRRAWQDYFEPNGIQEIAEHEAEIARREVQRVNAYTKMFEREESGPEGDQPIEVTPEEKRESVEHIKPMLLDEIDFGRALNTKWDREWVLDVFSEMSRELDSLHGVLMDRTRAGEDAAKLRSVQKMVEKRDREEWLELFRYLIDQEVRAVKGSGYLPEDKAHDIYIDDTIIPFYRHSTDRPEGAIGGQQKDGTNWGWHFMTVSAHLKSGRSLLLDTYPLRDEDELPDVVDMLVDRAEQHVTIDEVLMDSEFRKAEMLRWFKDRDTTFVIQYPKTDRIKRALVTMSGKFAHKEFIADKAGARVPVTLLAEPNYDEVSPGFKFEGVGDGPQSSIGDFAEGSDLEAIDMDAIDPKLHKGRRAYLTNKPIKDPDEIEEGDEAVSPETAIRRYKSRWRLETQFRVIKHSFLPKTRTRKWNIRVFYWMFASMMYNSWVMLDTFVRGDHPERVDEDPVLRARSYMKDWTAVPYSDD